MRNDLGIPGITYTVNDSGGVVRRRVVVQDTSGSSNTKMLCKNAAAANAVPVGVTRGGAANNQPVAVHVLGFEEIEAASAINIGDLVNISDTVGRIKVAGETAGTRNIVGRAVQSAAASGDIIMVDLTRLGDLV